MELRDIEIFLTLAEELHFGRTAERLHISTPRVSQTIAKQERRIGAPLFERTSRKVTLTPLGEQLRDDLQAGYRRILDGVESAASAARGGPETLTLGVLGPMWQDLAPITALFRTRCPQVRLRMREVRIDDPFALIRGGDVDLALVALPVLEPDLRVGPPAFTEPIVLVVRHGHELAGRTSVSLAEIAEYEILPSGLPLPDYWEKSFSPLPPRESEAPPPTREEILFAVSTGDAVAFACGQGIKYYDRGEAVYLPIDEKPTLSWGLVHRAGQVSRWAEEFERIAGELGPIELELDLDQPTLQRLRSVS
ncbi:LysR family transcriptional regulator [Nocardia goodfellowii]|uniref:DNA-binding transcriptional LysR family regulator n=1 Tax=Nocardia goodfellowii TaxID=882446 RepID=A0ABS4QEZ5_9NOCA|nr:LysR family transcriptional regulator [Nocardia goodfellowii]MBP2190242.1 DNA-binding transcriptional LysR family regulator [Nocardia goodfellowii]